MLHHFIQVVLPEIISAIEIVGVIIIIIGAARATYYYLRSVFDHKNYRLKILLGEALSLGLEFKMGAEILKTLLVEDYHDLYLLAAIIVIRVALTFVIHWEVASERKECSREELEDIELHGHITGSPGPTECGCDPRPVPENRKPKKKTKV